MSNPPNRKLRVLFLNDTWRNGGPGRTLFYILKFLDPDLIHRTVVLPRNGLIGELLGQVAEEVFFEPNLIENPFEPWSRAIEREDLAAPLMMRGVRAVGNVLRGAAGTAALARRVRQGRFDAVFCNGTTANFAGGALAAWTGVPTLWHVFYTQVGKVITGLHRRLSAGKSVRRIVCVSEPTSRLFDHCQDKVRVLHDAIDVDEFASAAVEPRLRAEFGLSRDTIVFGSQGRILPRKGYVEMIRAARLALDELTTEERGNVRFFVLGETPGDVQPDHLAQCRALVGELGLGEVFHFIGSRSDVKPYVADFDVAVVPSIYEDPLPRAVLESMAMGKPVLAFDVGGLGEMIQGGIHGTLVPGRPPDVNALGRELVRYARQAETRRSQGAAARERVEREFNARGRSRVWQQELMDLAGH